MESIIDLFHIEWKILIAQTINFFIVAFVLWRYAFSPISKVLSDRTKKIEDGLTMADEAKKALALSEEKYKEILVKAKNEAQKIIDDSVLMANKIRQEEIEKTKLETAKMLESGKKSLLIEKDSIMKEIKSKINDIVILSTEAVLKDIAHPQIDKNLVAKALESNILNKNE
jgi:F-type H+-transporting ATPase subunit b